MSSSLAGHYLDSGIRTTDDWPAADVCTVVVECRYIMMWIHDTAEYVDTIDMIRCDGCRWL